MQEVPKIITCEQGSPEWHSARAGFVTASVVADMLAKLKSGAEAAGRRNLRSKLAVERLTGRAIVEQFSSWQMKNGTETEPIARSEYELASGVMVQTAGFLWHPTIKWFGCSPDGLVMDGARIVGGCELKCPQPTAHLEYLRGGVLPADYALQVHSTLAVTGADWWDFCSYSPHFYGDGIEPAVQKLGLFVHRVHRDSAKIAEIEAEVEIFNAEVEKTVAELKGIK